MKHINFLLFIVLFTVSSGYCKTVVFYEKSFPTVDNGAIGRAALERAFASADVRFTGVADLGKNLSDGDLLVLPYGSAFPADAWEAIQHHLRNGNLLILGGRPFYVPVYRDSSGWRVEPPQNTYSRYLGIMYSYPAMQHGPWTLKWDEDAPFFSQMDSIHAAQTGHHESLNPTRVFVNAGYGGRYRGIGFLVDANGDRLAAPVVAEDFVNLTSSPVRGVFLSFDADSSYWNSEAGTDLMREAATYASYGGDRLWLDMQELTIDPGEHVTGAVDVLRRGEPAKLTLELLSGSDVLETRTVDCESSLREEIGLKAPLSKPGFYQVRATLSVGDTTIDRYTSGVDVRDSSLLMSGKKLDMGRDYFRLDGMPYLPVGVNYFSTDPYTSDFFVGGSLGGNAHVWERDFAEMERQGITIVRTGTWDNQARYLDQVTGAADERLLRAIEAYLDAASRHHMQVIFTFFAFNPQLDIRHGSGPDDERAVSGPNAYLDPMMVNAEIEYVRSIVSRFRDVPFLSYDLINEPSFSNPGRIWKGNSPNGDPRELAAWQQWLEKRYHVIDKLAESWRVPPDQLGTFSRVPLPDTSDLAPTRSGNLKTIRAVDYNLFAQDAFTGWVDTVIQAIRAAGSKQEVTVGQDEGGIVDRVLNQFWANSQVNYTVNHTWWRDDALLWGSVAAKNIQKPNLIEETGAQPVWAMDGSWRWADQRGMGLEERKLALAFANGNAGVLHWDWTRSDDYGIMRRDGSQKEWMQALKGIAAFAHDAQPYAVGASLPDIALVLPQSLQLSIYSEGAIEAQQKAVRALYHYARGVAFAIGEDQLSQMPDAKLVIVPAPWVITQDAWDLLMKRVSEGATLLISGRIDADEHWHSIPERTRNWNVKYTYESLITREAEISWPGGIAHLSYSGNKTSYCERGVLGNGKTFADIPLGKGNILYFSLPLELADQIDEVGRIYEYAMKRAGVSSVYETSCKDPGILISPTKLHDATLYVLTSESADTAKVKILDKASDKAFMVDLPPSRAALLLVEKDGRVLASYRAR